ncbi:sucrose-6-phosphate hydrolase SacC (GH32 family) [Ereboglobus sp. PH5-5]|uniref:GH32 C-terminal domain-containing protein n=1 Tax=Ereboglobus sp. PH5-5 TaxID=2940529 RepID=UPI00240685E9|nr:GH32 C-terminal domain-containing protein [Ereboglobus sp. PH5-5]MDF9832769.1 sucrose-6-phosphate hydrolase SacC (GH32 family) [Ereboglobus sp. PH5-5]
MRNPATPPKHPLPSRARRFLSFVATRLPAFLVPLLFAAVNAQTSHPVFKDPVAVWNMDAPKSTAGDSVTISGAVSLGQPLDSGDRAASRARGGDGIAARFSGGFLRADRFAAPKGDRLTILLRIKPTAGLANSELFCKHGGHAKTSFNVYANNGAIGFQIGVKGRPNLGADVRLPASAIERGAWHDVIARYDGRQIALFVNGRRVASAPVSGELRENVEPLIIGKAMRGDIDHAAIWARALSDDEIVALSGGAAHVAKNQKALRPKVEAVTGRDGLGTVDQLRAARDLRAKLAADPHRPRYHLMPPDGYWNDINGTLYWKGRYHVMFLGRQAPDTQTVLEGRDNDHPREIWLHASSADLVHWVHHTPAVAPVFDGSMPRGIYSGDAVNDAPVPTLIYHVPGQGTCIATADDPNDPELVRWTPDPRNPVISDKTAPPEVRVFDPTAWREADGTYYALIGNKNGTPGYEGDSNSLYRSTDLVNWEYRGPFYKSDRKWTAAHEDAACPDFFPIGNGKHMLLMHCHQPFNSVHYYIGAWDRAAEKFIPESHGRMSWAAGSVAGPETLLDGKGRRVFWGWVQEPYRPTQIRGQTVASVTWASVATLPRILSLFPDNTLRIQPAPELEALRHNERSLSNFTVSGERDLGGLSGDTLEIRAKITPGKSGRFGIIVRATPDRAEQTVIWIDPGKNTLTADISKSTLNPAARWTKGRAAFLKNLPRDQHYVTEQTAPFTLAPGEAADLRVFVDKSVIEVYVNERQCLTQRVYPTRPDAKDIALIAEESPVTVEKLQVWDMHPTQ